MASHGHSNRTRIHIDHNRISTILGILSAVSAGESSPLFIEERTRELQDFIPFLPTAVSWLGEAMDRLAAARDKDVVNDPAALREFMLHNDMVCRAQGALAALLCVGESLRSDAVIAETPAPRKTRKGKSNVRRTKDQTGNT